MSATYQVSFLKFCWDFNYKHYFYDKRTCIGIFKSSLSARLYLEVLIIIAQFNLKAVCIDGFSCYILFYFLFSSLCSVFFFFLLTRKFDKFKKCILFELSLYEFTVNTKYINLLVGLFQLFIFSIVFYAFSIVVLHHMTIVKTKE